MALAVNPNLQRAYLMFQNVYERQELYEEAIIAYQKTLSEEEVASLAAAYQTLGKEGYWRWMLDYWTEMAKQRYVGSMPFAQVYAYLGEKDQAFEQLEKAYEEHDVGLTQFNGIAGTNPAFDSIRDDPRFHDLLRRLNLEP